MLDLSDLELIAAVARTGSVRAAAKSMNAHVATIYRRLAAMDRRAGTPLLHRAHGRLTPTEYGDLVVQVAQEGQARLAELNRKLSGAATVLAGNIVVTTTDSLTPIVCPAVARFRAANSLVRVHLKLSNRDADLSRHEAEVAIRPTRTPPESLIGRRVAPFSYGIYAKDRRAADWIALDASLSGIPSSRWLKNRLGGEAPSLIVNSMWAAGQACAAGGGRALLPAYVAKPLGLHRLEGPIAELESEVWLLTHEDLSRTARIRAFMTSVAEDIRDAFKAGHAIR